VLSNSVKQLLLVIRNGRQEVHARTLTSVCKSEIFKLRSRSTAGAESYAADTAKAVSFLSWTSLRVQA